MLSSKRPAMHAPRPHIVLAVDSACISSFLFLLISILMHLSPRQLIRMHRKHFVLNNLLTGTPKAWILDSSGIFLGYERHLLQCEDLSSRTRTCSFMSITDKLSPSFLGEVCRSVGELALVDPPYAHPLRAATLSLHCRSKKPIALRAVFSKDGEPKLRH